MIVFDKDKELKNIGRNGIGATEVRAMAKLKYFMEDLIVNSTYKKGKIISKAKTVAADYFCGLPEDIVLKELETLFEDIKSRPVHDTMQEHEKKIITLYKSEMEHIAELKDLKLIQLAFATLVIHKFQGQYIENGEKKCYKSVEFNKTDAFSIAGLNSSSGTKKNELWRQLAERGYIAVNVRTNKTYKYSPNWISMALLSVPYNEDLLSDGNRSEVFMQITNYDDVLLYLRRFMGDSNVDVCADCGCPIEKTSNKKTLCGDCAAERKRESNRKSKIRTAVA